MLERIVGFIRAPGSLGKQAAMEAMAATGETRLARSDPLAGIGSRGIFIIGAARTGTTILQNALNDSPNIFLLGEPAMHHDPGSADFATRYNAMHRCWGNQENKSSYCPLLFEADADWQAHLLRLAQLHQYVGAKVVINHWHAQEEAEQLFAFQERHFYLARYIFTFRNPLDVVLSTRKLAAFNGDTPANFHDVLRGFFVVMRLYMRALRTLPHVSSIFHESIDAEVFSTLEQSLGIPLAGSARYYDQRKVRHYTLDDVPEDHRALVANAIALYEDFRGAATAGFDLLQIEQNDGQLHPDHFTVLGRLCWRVSRFLAVLDPPPPSA